MDVLKVDERKIEPKKYQSPANGIDNGKNGGLP
jgi:hypothetical protein